MYLHKIGFLQVTLANLTDPDICRPNSNLTC